LTQITHGSDAYYPNLSPDGTKVAYFDDEVSLIDVLNGETVQVDPGMICIPLAGLQIADTLPLPLIEPVTAIFSCWMSDLD
jgi:hypothetical protein